MKLNNITQIVVAIGLATTIGCDTIYMQNSVYQYDVVATDTSPFVILPNMGLTVDLKPNNCVTDHYGDLQPFYNRPNTCEVYEGEGYCCKWTTESTDDYLCEEEWCYWHDTCDWDLNSWGEVCTLKDKENIK